MKIEPLKMFIADQNIYKKDLATAIGVKSPQISIWLKAGEHHVAHDPSGECHIVKIVKSFNVKKISKKKKRYPMFDTFQD